MIDVSQFEGHSKDWRPGNDGQSIVTESEHGGACLVMPQDYKCYGGHVVCETIDVETPNGKLILTAPDLLAELREARARMRALVEAGDRDLICAHLDCSDRALSRRYDEAWRAAQELLP